MSQENDSDDPYGDLETNIDMKDFSIPIESLSSTPETQPDQSVQPQLEPDEIPPDPSVQSQLETEPDETPPPIPGPLDEIKEQLNTLSKAFESKLKYDEHKNKIIDELHQALQDHRQGLLQKYVHRMFMDVLKVVDDIRKFTAHYHNKPRSDELADKLLKFLETTASDLEDLFSWEGITSFTCEGNLLDPTRQRVVNKVQTDEPEKDKTIAERLRPGYQWDEKIIRSEMVSIFVYQKNGIIEDEKPDDQTS